MDEKEKYGYIYKITDLTDNIIYVGKRAKPYFDEKYWGSGKIIKLRVKSHGRDNMKREVLEWCYSKNIFLKDGFLEEWKIILYGYILMVKIKK